MFCNQLTQLSGKLLIVKISWVLPALYLKRPVSFFSHPSLLGSVKTINFVDIFRPQTGTSYKGGVVVKQLCVTSEFFQGCLPSCKLLASCSFPIGCRLTREWATFCLSCSPTLASHCKCRSCPATGATTTCRRSNASCFSLATGYQSSRWLGWLYPSMRSEGTWNLRSGFAHWYPHPRWTGKCQTN